MDDAAGLRRPRTDRSRRYSEAEGTTVTELHTRSGRRGPVPAASAAPEPRAAASSPRPAPVAVAAQPSTVAGSLRRHWLRSGALVAVGMSAGLAWAWHTPDVYTAETRLSVGSQELSAQAVPGYVLALQTMTSNYARYVQTTDLVRTSLEKSMGASAAQVVGVTASPIPESNILRIEVDATEPATAVRAATQVGDSMVAQVKQTGSSKDPDLATLKDLSLKAAQADQQAKAAQASLDAVSHDPRATAAKVDAARKAAAEAQASADVLDVQQQASASAYQNATQNSGQPATLTVVRPAAVTRSDGVASYERWGAFGALAGAALAVGAAALGLARRRRRSPGGAGSAQDDVRAPREDAAASWERVPSPRLDWLDGAEGPYSATR